MNHPQQNRHNKDPQGVMFDQANVSRSRFRWGVATPPSLLSGGLLDMKGRHTEEDRPMDSRVGPILSTPQVSPSTNHVPSLSLSPCSRQHHLMTLRI